MSGGRDASVARRRRPLRSTTRTRRYRRTVPRSGSRTARVHGQKVGVDGEGRLLGRCDGCAREYARALMKMRRQA
jgi:hypothetical protein